MRQAEEPGMGAGGLKLSEQLVASPEGRRPGVVATDLLVDGMQQHQVLAVLRVVQAVHGARVACALSQGDERGSRQLVSGNHVETWPGSREASSDTGLKGAQRQAVLLQTLPVKVYRLGQHRVAKLG